MTCGAKRRLRRQWDRLGRDAIRALQGQMLQRFVRDQVLPYSKHYRALFAKHGVTAGQIRTLDDLRRIPFTSKLDLLPTPEHGDQTRDFALLPDEQALARRPDVMLRALLRGRAAVRRDLAAEYRPVFLTSTTGRSSAPVSFLYTQHDLRHLDSAGERLVAVLGAKSAHRLVNAFPYAPHLAFWQAHYACLAYNVFQVSTGGGKVMGTDGNIRIIDKVKATALIGMPTFLYHVLSEAREQGKRFPELGTLALGGEKVATGMRTKLRELVRDLGGKSPANVVATYGFTEAKVAWGECPFAEAEESGGYHLYPDLGLFEVVNPESGEPVPDGESGELVYTPLDARGSVVLRYRTGDVIEGGLQYGPCPWCGRMAPRLVGNIGRQSEKRELHLDKLKGTLVDFNELEHLLDNYRDVGAWQLELRKANDDPHELDELILHVESKAPEGRAKIEQELSDLMASRTELRPNAIVFHAAEDMRRRHGVGVELKEKRVVDHRPKDGKPAPPREGGREVVATEDKAKKAGKA
ncbi:MAG: AMP-binding protein [Verrucomicrobia bacterium]|nr:AMP-binding protein [Verrucomicrobiota bacterium]